MRVWPAKIQGGPERQRLRAHGPAAGSPPVALLPPSAAPTVSPIAGPEAPGTDTPDDALKQAREALRKSGLLSSGKKSGAETKDGEHQPVGVDADAINARIDAALAKGDAALANADKLRGATDRPVCRKNFDSEKMGAGGRADFAGHRAEAFLGGAGAAAGVRAAAAGRVLARGQLLFRAFRVFVALPHVSFPVLGGLRLRPGS